MDSIPSPASEVPALLPESYYRRLPYVRIGIVALAALLRLWQLDLRPPHFDEGVNGWFLDQMHKIGYYKYDPTNYHGPLHFYVLFVFKTLLGRNLWALRLPIAIIGTLTIDWFFRFQRFFGLRACAWAALAMAVSPGFLYYQRDAIHETWLVFFLVMACWGLLGLWQEGQRKYLWAAGMGLTGMILTKETYIIHVGCLLLALPLVAVFEQYLPSLRTIFSAPPPLPAESREGRAPLLPDRAAAAAGFDLNCAPQQWHPRDLLAVMATSVALIVLFYSGTFHHWKGIAGLVTAYAPWGTKANEGEGHNKPFLYWLQLIWHNEPLVFLGLLASVRYAVLPSVPDWRARLLAIYALGNMTAYSLIPYKTPWCVMAWAWPFFLLGGLAIAEWPLWLGQRQPRWVADLLFVLGGTMTTLAGISRFAPFAQPEGEHHLFFEYLPPSMLATVAVASFAGGVLALLSGKSRGPGYVWRLSAWGAGACLSGVSAYLALGLNFQNPTDEKEAYVYVQTFNDVNEIVLPLYDLARENPANYHLRGMIICESTYPLPWLLGDFTSVGYYSHDNKPSNFHADFLLVTKGRVAEVEKGLDDVYFKQALHLRAALEEQTLYLRAPLFQHLMPGRTPEFHPAPPEAATPVPAATLEDRLPTT